MKQTLSFLGNGSAFNIKAGNTSAYLKIDSELILIDCGENIFEKIIRKNLLKDIDIIYVFITHTHSDHIGSLSSLIYYCYYITHTKINIYFSYSLNYILNNMGNRDITEYNMYALKINYGFNLRLKSDNILEIIPIKVTHKEDMVSIGYIIDTTKCINSNINKTKLWYSGDTNEISKLAMTYHPIEIYHDACSIDYISNPHCYYKKLMNYFPKEKRNNIYCIHLDKGLKFKLLLLKEGFKIAKLL